MEEVEPSVRVGWGESDHRSSSKCHYGKRLEQVVKKKELQSSNAESEL